MLPPSLLYRPLYREKLSVLNSDVLGLCGLLCSNDVRLDVTWAEAKGVTAFIHCAVSTASESIESEDEDDTMGTDALQRVAIACGIVTMIGKQWVHVAEEPRCPGHLHCSVVGSQSHLPFPCHSV
jgi:hypothetical protein